MVTVMAMGTFLCFNCCITEQPQPKRRRKIDRSMIGEPTNFRHTSHIGSGDVMSNGSNSSLSNLQDQMSSKSGGDDDVASPVALHLNVIDLPVRNNS